ncbi:MAG: ribbon-helix-helix protein, CopG family [Halobacteriota archaeon]|nr:ribbon-helix-helix protein, CopG family [Halobacteriota archaeon]
MKNPVRITIALDEETLGLFEEMKEETDLSQSELVRRALRFYHEHRSIVDSGKNISTYMDMLPTGEHVILDLDHWLLFLDLIESSPMKEEFWKGCKNVADSHAEQLSHKITSPRALLERLESCNFFKLIKNSQNEFTLLLGTDITKDWVKRLVEDFSESMGFDIMIKEDISKLRVRVGKE